MARTLPRQRTPGHGPDEAGVRHPWPALSAASLWLAAALSAGYWGLQIWGSGTEPGLPAPVARLQPPSDVAAVARALGGGSAGVQAVSATPGARFRLHGVVARQGAQGAALIAVEGQPARPFVVGSVVTDGLVLQSVDRRGARLGVSVQGATSVELALPEQQP